MNILMMTNTYTPIVGGIEKSIRVFSEQLRKMGHEVWIVAPEYEGMPRNETNVLRLPAIEKVKGTPFSINLPIPGTVVRLMKRFSPEIVHSHHPFFMGDTALRLSGQYEIPLIFTYHTMFEQYLHYLPFQNEQIGRFIVDLATGYANHADRVIAPSASVRDVLIERGITRPVHVVPTGIDTVWFKKGSEEALRRRLGLSAEDFVVGHVGRLEPEKNPEFLTKSVACFLRKRDAHCIIVGDGSSRPQMEQIFKQSGVLEQVHFIGVLQGQEKVDAYHAMNIFAVASKSETQGVVLAEAMAAGVPVVGLDAPGVRDIVCDGKNGRLLLQEDPDDYAVALCWCADQTAEAMKHLKSQAIETAKGYDIKKTAELLFDIYVAASEQCFVKDRSYSLWEVTMARLKTEYEMLANLGGATGRVLMRELKGKRRSK